jgi:hypothetical protein
MKKISTLWLLVALFLASTFLTACDDGKRLPSRQVSEVVCPADVFVCPDGNTVPRNPDNACEFYACDDTACKGGCSPDFSAAPDVSGVK